MSSGSPFPPARSLSPPSLDPGRVWRRKARPRASSFTCSRLRHGHACGGRLYPGSHAPPRPGQGRGALLPGVPARPFAPCSAPGLRYSPRKAGTRGEHAGLPQSPRSAGATAQQAHHQHRPQGPPSPRPPPPPCWSRVCRSRRLPAPHPGPGRRCPHGTASSPAPLPAASGTSLGLFPVFSEMQNLPVASTFLYRISHTHLKGPPPARPPHARARSAPDSLA